MNAIEALALFPASEETLARLIEMLPAKQKKTAKALLESTVKLAYILYATGEKQTASIIVDSIAVIPFSNSYDYWTWIEGALVLQGKLAIERKDEQTYQVALKCATTALKTGTDLQVTVKMNVHRRFLEGQNLDSDFDQESNVGDEFDRRVVYLMALLKIEFFGGSEVWPVTAVAEEAAVTINRISELVAQIGLYKLPPYK